MDIRQLEYLVAIEEEGTVSKAAEKLHMTQPAVTRSVQRLEEELGCTFFDRTKNSVVLNDDGRVVISYAKNVLREASAMREGIQSYLENKNKIRIASCAPAPVWGLKSIYHDQKTETLLTEDAEVLLEEFNSYKASLLVMDYAVHAKETVCLPYVKEQLYIAVLPDDPLAMCPAVTFEQINGTVMLVGSKVGYWAQVIEEGMPDSRMVYEEADTYAVLQRVTSLPVFRTNLTIPHYRTMENRIYIPITDPQASLQFYVHYRKNDRRFEDLKEQLKGIRWNLVEHVL